jgi:hypothetical protein
VTSEQDFCNPHPIERADWIRQNLACDCLKFRMTAYDSTSSRSDARAGDDGKLWKAMQASIAISGLFPPCIADGKVLLDRALVKLADWRDGNHVPGDHHRRECGTLSAAAPLVRSGIWMLAAAFRSARIPRVEHLLWSGALASSKGK